MEVPTQPSETGFTVPASVLAQREELLRGYRDVVERTCAFSRVVGDVVRGDPRGLGPTVQGLAKAASQVFQRWNLELLYLLSVENEMRFSQLRSCVKGISNRSLSLKLDDLERLGYVSRTVIADSPPRVVYALTEQGRLLTRLSFPMVIQLNMPLGLATVLGQTAPVATPKATA